MNLSEFSLRDQSQTTVGISGRFNFVAIIDGLMLLPTVAILVAIGIVMCHRSGEVKDILRQNSAEMSKAATDDQDLVDGQGQAMTFEEAKLRAKRDALEKRLGVIISSDIIIENHAVVRDIIHKQSIAGYVSNVSVVEHHQINGKHRVKIHCRITAKLWQEIVEKSGSLRRLLGPKRVVVIYHKPQDSVILAGYQELERCMKEVLLDRGIRIFKTQFAAASYRQIVASMRRHLTSPDFQGIADNPNSFVVLIKLDRRDDEGRPLLKLNADVFNFGREFAKLQSLEWPVAKLETKLHWERAARSAAPLLANHLLAKLIERLSRNNGGREYLLYFQGFSNQQNRNFAAALARLKDAGQFTWIGSPSFEKNMMNIDIAAAIDPEATISTALGAVFPLYCMRQENMILYIPDTLPRLLQLAIATLALALAALVVIRRCRWAKSPSGG